MKTLALLLTVTQLAVSIPSGGFVSRHARLAKYDVHNGTAPAGCRRLASDVEWPKPEEWASAMLGVTKLADSTTMSSPDYAFRAKTTEDVQKAISFVSKNNIRLSVINSGHDYLGGNDAASGLRLDVSQLGGIRVYQSFEATPDGAESPSDEVNTVIPIPGQQAAVTFGAGLSTQRLNNAIFPSKLVTVGAAHGEVTVAGGWGQAGGHSPLSPKYGLGVDQFLEFKVVTADGKLKVANMVSNPDLFWALRGGAGGTFGVVVEATVKAYPDLPVTVANYWVNATKSPNNIGSLLTMLEDRQGLWDAYGYLATQMPALSKIGTSGYFYALPDAIKGNAVYIGEVNQSQINEVWTPIITKMQSFPGMQAAQTRVFTYPNFKSFFDDNYGSIDANEDMRKQKRHGPGGDEPMDMSKPPTPFGLVPTNSHLLSEKDLKNPGLVAALKPSHAVCLLLVGGGKVMEPDDETSVVPAWRKAYVHALSMKTPQNMIARTSLDGLQKMSTDMGAYRNEAFYDTPDWKNMFWGSNYERLSQIKTKYDPDMLFWISPGINADYMRVTDGRVCKCTAPPAENQKVPPTDILNVAPMKSLADITNYLGEGAASGVFPAVPQAPMKNPGETAGPLVGLLGAMNGVGAGAGRDAGKHAAKSANALGVAVGMKGMPGMSGKTS